MKKERDEMINFEIITTTLAITLIVRKYLTTRVSKEKIKWLKSIDAVKFDRPMTWLIGDRLYSDRYLNKTPLEELKRKHSFMKED